VKILISDPEWNSGSQSRFVVSLSTCGQSLRSFIRDLIGFDIVCRFGKFQSSLGLNPRVIHVFDVVRCDLKARLSLYGI